MADFGYKYLKIYVGTPEGTLLTSVVPVRYDDRRVALEDRPPRSSRTGSQAGARGRGLRT